MTLHELSDNPSRLGKETILGCPECNGILYEVEGAAPVQFRCRRGHVVMLDEICPGSAIKLREMLAKALGALKSH